VCAKIKIFDAELAKVRRRRPDSLSAYEIAVRAHTKLEMHS